MHKAPLDLLSWSPISKRTQRLDDSKPIVILHAILLNDISFRTHEDSTQKRTVKLRQSSYITYFSKDWTSAHWLLQFFHETLKPTSFRVITRYIRAQIVKKLSLPTQLSERRRLTSLNNDARWCGCYSLSLPLSLLSYVFGKKLKKTKVWFHPWLTKTADKTVKWL